MNKMTNYLCFLLIFIQLWTCNEAKFVNKALYCIDPDTGTLHPANSTWAATKFCGTYNCKIRKKNTTEIEYMPTESVSKFRSPDLNDPNSESNSVAVRNSEQNLQSILRAENTLNFVKDDDDRYLTESEIKTISEVLYTVKKSDLDSIMEIYNLAQDLYKAIDKESSVGDVVENKIAKYKLNKVNSENSRSNVDYLLEADDFVPKSTALPTDMHYAGTNNHIIKNPIAKASFGQPSNYDNRPQYVSHTNSGPIPYRLYSYNGPPYTTPPLPKQDKMPLYTVRYVYTTHPYSVPNNQNTMPRYDWPKDITPTAPYMAYTNNTALIIDNSQKLHRQSRPLLPYPFMYMQQYNQPYPTFTYNKIPLNLLTGKKQKTYIGSSSLHNLFKNDGVKNETEEIYEERPKETAKKDNKLVKMILNVDKSKDIEEKIKFPPWKTASLSSSTLEDIRANIPKKTIWFKTFPLRRKIELEQVGKATQLEELDRTKRDIEDFVGNSEEKISDEEYEAYVEKKVCETDLEPGFFQLGNTSLTYPSCCPQRIKAFVNK